MANLYANSRNTRTDAEAFLAEIPAEHVAYLHVAGGIAADGVYHDTHAHPVPPGVFDLLAAACAWLSPRGILLERDDRFGTDAELAAELAAIRAVRDGKRAA